MPHLPPAKFKGPTHAVTAPVVGIDHRGLNAKNIVDWAVPAYAYSPFDGRTDRDGARRHSSRDAHGLA
jgi:hypothetical protein